jgi:hypothetical protein
METVCMHCRRLLTPRGRWVAVADERMDELRRDGKMAYGCCFACMRERFAPNPERRPEHRAV